jgi:methionyl aminopeptidase
MTIDGEDDIAGLRLAGAAVAEARDVAIAAVQSGITTAELDAIARDVLNDHGAVSAPMLAYDFPGHTCISVNDAVAHGIPSRDRVLTDGDMVNIDVSAALDGYWADTGASATVGTPGPVAAKLLEATRLAQSDAMALAQAGRQIRFLGRAVQKRADEYGFSIIENLNGHGVGRFIHEAPEVPSVEHRRNRDRLVEGMVIAIEPFLSVSATHAIEDDDGWTLRTNDGSMAAQFEHTMIVTRGEPIVLTLSA